MSFNFIGVLLAGVLLSGCCTLFPDRCTINPPGDRFSCLAAPSGEYKAGTVIRTIDRATADAGGIAPDQLVTAFPSKGTPSAADFADIKRTFSTGATAALTGAAFKKINVDLDASAGVGYDITLEAKSNTSYTAYDDLRKTTFDDVAASNALITGARYFFIKQALGSQEINYEIKSKGGVKAKAKLTTSDTGLTADVKIFDSATNITSNKKELIACVVLEEIKIAKGAAGELTLNATPTKSSEAVNAVLAAGVK